MQTPGGDPDLAAESELAAIRELGGGVVHDDGAVDAVQEFGGGGRILRNDGVGVTRAVAGDMRQGFGHSVHHPDGQDRRQVFSGPIGFDGGPRLGHDGASPGVAAQDAAGGQQVFGNAPQQGFRCRGIDQQGFGRATDRDLAHLGVQYDSASFFRIGGGVEVGVA